VTVPALPEPRCAVCGTVVAPDAARCPSCGLHRPTATGARVLTRSAMLVLALVLLVAWVATLAVIASAR
jgi:predicted nucleic acid-binding Zn ribbon protein